jgi:hypothetical protein
LVENRFLLLELSELFLEIVVLFLLIGHPQLKCFEQWINQRAGSVRNLVIIVLDFVLHCFELLPEEFNQFVVLLQILITLTHQILQCWEWVLRRWRCGRRHWWSFGELGLISLRITWRTFR